MKKFVYSRRVIQSITIGISLVLAAVFFSFIFFPKQLVLGALVLPLWSIVGAVAVLSLAFLVLLSRWTEQSLRFLFAIVFTPGLTWHVCLSIREQQPWQGELLWLSLLWCWALAEIVLTIWPQVIKAHLWKYLAWTTVVLLTAAGVAIRFSQLDADTPLLLLIVFMGLLTLRTVPLTQSVPSVLHQRIGISLTVLFVLWGSWIRISAVDTFVFQNDEYFHVNTAVGYLNSGEYKQWHFVAEETTTDYTRSWAYTWQVAQSVRMFGMDEWVFRLPALLWGVLLLILLPAITFRWTRSWMTAAFATAMIAFDPSFIWSSTYTRMYSWFFVMVLIGVWMVWESLKEGSSQRQWKRALWLVGGCVASAVAVWIHVSGLLLFGGYGVAIVLLWIQHPKEQWYRMLGLFGIGAVALTLIIEYVHPYLPLYFFVIRKVPAEQYLDYPMQFFIVPSVALLAIVAGFIMRYRKHIVPVWIVLAYGIAVPLLVYFAYFANRYGARKYSLFFFPLFFILIAWAWTRWSSALSRSVAVQYGVGVLSVLLVLLPISIPGVGESWLLEKARSDKTYADLEQYDYKKAYDLMFEHVEPEDAVVILSPRHYYLTRHDLNYILMGSHRRMDVKEFQKIVNDHPRGWVVWPARSGHMNPGLEQFIRKHFPQLPTEDTRMFIYYWGDISLE